jgi:hypothetical protein
LEQDGLVAQVDPEIVKGIIGLPFAQRHLQGTQMPCIVCIDLPQGLMAMG